MTRVLYWNIQKFARNKINNPSVKRKQIGSSLSSSMASHDRWLYIMDHFQAVQPDIFVLVELCTAYDARGRLVRGDGLLGARILLDDLRLNFGNQWMLVPPIQSGPNEAVGVFYNSARRYFTGPWEWPGGAGAAIARQPTGAGGNYGAPFDRMLPNPALPNGNPRGNIPGGSLYNGGVPERHVAANVSFTDRRPAPPVPMVYNGRAPYQVTFAEVDGGNVVQRNLTLFAIHSPASNAARQYLRDLSHVSEIVDNVQANEVRVVVGDFNYNLFDPALARKASWNLLEAAPGSYQLVMTPAGAPPAQPDGYPTIFATHIKTSNKAVYWSTNTSPTYYAGYGYYGSERIQNFYSIDNFYVRYGANFGGQAPQNFTILNGITGSPYNLNPTPGAPYPGALAFGRAMRNQAPFNAPPAQAPPYNPGLRKSFKGWDNYGRIRSTSDHLALVVDV